MVLREAQVADERFRRLRQRRCQAVTGMAGRPRFRVVRQHEISRLRSR